MTRAASQQGAGVVVNATGGTAAPDAAANATATDAGTAKASARAIDPNSAAATGANEEPNWLAWVRSFSQDQEYLIVLPFVKWRQPGLNPHVDNIRLQRLLALLPANFGVVTMDRHDDSSVDRPASIKFHVVTAICEKFNWDTRMKEIYPLLRNVVYVLPDWNRMQPGYSPSLKAMCRLVQTFSMSSVMAPSWKMLLPNDLHMPQAMTDALHNMNLHGATVQLLKRDELDEHPLVWSSSEINMSTTSNRINTIGDTLDMYVHKTFPFTCVGKGNVNGTTLLATSAAAKPLMPTTVGRHRGINVVVTGK